MAHITSLRLTDFRNYADLDLPLSGGPVVLYGENGAGKTNLMEAVSLLTPGRGMRRAQLPDLARRDGETLADIWAVAAKVQSGSDDPLAIGVGQVPANPGRRSVRVDGRAASGTQLAQCLSVMWLTPAQDRLFTGPASDRRRFLDRFALASNPEHGKSGLRYEKARAERNRLLSDGIHDDLWFDALEADMADFGAKMAVARAGTVEALKAQIAARGDSDFPRAQLWLDGEAEDIIASGGDAADAQSFIASELRADRARDRRAGRTLRGLHKSDLRVRYADKNMPAGDCSTGEQKALLIGLILAQARAVTHNAGRPILLLDEVAAHLDAGRRAALIEELIALETQVFMTGTDADLFESFAGRAQVFEVSGGAVTIAS